VFDPAGRLLLILRGRPPGLGLWSVPGGRCLPDEPADQACVREVREETGLPVRIVRFAGRVERDAPDGGVYVIDDFVCRVLDGENSPVAGDDARDVRWVTRAAFDALNDAGELVPGLRAALQEWDALPR